MIVYVVDNNIFSRSFNNVSIDVFDDIWEPWGELMDSGKIISVEEVLCELDERWGDNSEEGKWLANHKNSFLKTTNEEGFIVAEIFRNKKFREGIKEASLRNGTPEADALLVAKAKAVRGIIVTAESDQKPNSEKIPNIATAMGVPYIKINDFYKVLRNKYNGRDEHTGVSVYCELGVPMPMEQFINDNNQQIKSAI